jgi:hypothetical protein
MFHHTAPYPKGQVCSLSPYLTPFVRKERLLCFCHESDRVEPCLFAGVGQDESSSELGIAANLDYTGCSLLCRESVSPL